MLDRLANFTEDRAGTIYVVTGWQRSFTSAMMKALIAGGMDAVYDESRNRWAKQSAVDPSYHPNPDGLFEMDDEKRNQFFAMPNVFNGKLVKILDNHGRFDLPMWNGKYRVVVMLREPSEIRESYRRFFGHEPQFTDGVRTVTLTDPLYEQLMRRTIRACANRRDITYTVIKGSDLMAYPRNEFGRLYARAWNFDVEKAAVQIDPARYRIRCGLEPAMPAASVAS